MAGTVRRIIERIKEQRSGGNSVVALTAETRLVLHGFDPERFDYNTPDDPGRLARIGEIAAEMGIDVGDLIEQAEVAPATRATAADGLDVDLSRLAGPGPDHPLQRFKLFADEALMGIEDVGPGAQSGAPFAVLIKASLLMALYSVISDRVFCDQLQYSSLYSWFLDLAPGTTYPADAFGGDRQEALGRASARQFFDEVVPRAGGERLFSHELLQANGRQIKSWMTAGAAE